MKKNKNANYPRRPSPRFLISILFVSSMMAFAITTMDASAQPHRSHGPVQPAASTPRPGSARSNTAIVPKATPEPKRPGGKNKPPRVAPKKYTMGQFVLAWTYKDFPLKIRTMTAPFRHKIRVGETKVVANLANLEIGKEILDGKVDVLNGRSTILFLVVQNTTPNPVSFVVSPHQIHPVHATLGFQFKCLCYGHTYTVPPGMFWYRLVELIPFDNNATEPIRLVHDVVGVPAPPAK